MSTPYTRGAALADRILGSDKGETGAIRRTTVTGGGPSVGEGTTTVTDYPCRLAAFPVALRDVDGTYIKAGDWRVLVATGIGQGQANAWPLDDAVDAIEDFADIEPTTTDKLVCSQGVLTIVDAGQFDPAGVVTHYKMIARK
jgi:hypothetical protein